ncbi:hypothetical protein AMK59_6770 [Oryctes borbonicus]|uniref:Condensin complex subunit 2 n=1 Tax=Oryctes borbonicus TaxID=1629725 RepID=A0A0T6AU34_9SCAR|nr:hypothetical protein AMK59_6770 [Oryctes borbonicus]
MVPNNFVENIDINASNYQNMSTNKIPMDHARCNFNLLNNEDCGFISYDNKDPTLLEKIFPKMFPMMKPITICPEFKNFNVDDDDQTFNDSMISIVNDLEKSKSSGPINNDVVYDDDGIPIPDLDGSIHDIFADQADPIDFEGEELVTGQTANKRIEMITSFCPLDIPTEKNALDRSTANNSNIFLETVWVGPSHWKNKRILHSRPRYSGNPDQRVPQSRKKKRSTKRLEPTAIDVDASPVINFEKLCRGKAKSDTKKYTLPPNNLFSPGEFDYLMLQKLKPKSEYQSKEAKESEFEHSPYDYDNPDDSQYCSQIDLAEIIDDRDKETNVDGEQVHNDVGNGIEKQNEPENDLPLCLDTEDALIEGPDLVTQVYVPYAHRSKNVNMRRLKSAMLECLTGKPVENNAPPEELHVQPTAFSTVLKQLPRKLPKGERNNVSVAMAFFSLLHLTNEHNLKLTGSKQLNDVKIE